MSNTVIPFCYLMLIRDGKICLGKRRNTKFFDGLYSMPAGHIEDGETAMDGIVREALEEAGIILDPAELEFVVSGSRMKFVTGVNKETVDFVFKSEKWRGEVTNAEPDKCEGWEWFDLEHLPTEIIPGQHDMINAYLTGKRYVEWRS